MDTVHLYLTVQQHRLISPSLAMAVGVEYSFLCCQEIICHDYSNSFNLFRLLFSSSCWGVMQTLWCTSANSIYVYKLINSVISLRVVKHGTAQHGMAWKDLDHIRMLIELWPAYTHIAYCFPEKGPCISGLRWTDCTNSCQKNHPCFRASLLLGVLDAFENLLVFT